MRYYEGHLSHDVLIALALSLLVIGKRDALHKTLLNGPRTQKTPRELWHRVGTSISDSSVQPTVFTVVIITI